MIRLLTRYIGTDFLVYFLSCLLSLTAIFVTFMALGELELLKNEHGTARFIQVVLSGVPLLLETVTPISVLLATVLTFIGLSKSSEVVAMTAAGYGPLQLIQPILALALIICGFSYYNQSYLAPLLGADKKLSLISSSNRNVRWRFFQGELIHIGGIQRSEKRATRSLSLAFGEGKARFKVKAITRTNGLKLDQGLWSQGESVRVQFQEARREIFTTQPRQIPEDHFPTVFEPELVNPRYSPFTAVLQEIELKRNTGIDYSDDLFSLYQKIAALLSIFVMILLALPFSLVSGRSANIRIGIVTAIVLGFIFWLVDQIFVSLYDAKFVGAEIAAFGGNLLFFSIALLFIRLKRE